MFDNIGRIEERVRGRSSTKETILFPNFLIKQNMSQNNLNSSVDVATEKDESINKIKALFNSFKHKHDMIFSNSNDKKSVKPLFMNLELDRIKEK